MRKYTKTGEKRYSVLSRKGHFTKPVLIHETIENKRKPASLAGKVLKPHKPLMTQKSANQTIIKVKAYINALKEAGVNVHPTRILIIPTRKKGKVQLNFVQDLISKNLILDQYLKHCNEKEAINVLKKTMTLFNNINDYNKKGHKLGIDSALRNLAVVNGEVVLIDIYPALLRNGITTTGKEALKSLRNPLTRNLGKIFSQFAIKKANTIIDSLFNIKKRRKRFIKHFLEIRPELKTQLSQVLEK